MAHCLVNARPLFEPMLEINFSEILSENHISLFKEMYLKMVGICLSLNVLND